MIQREAFFIRGIPFDKARLESAAYKYKGDPKKYETFEVFYKKVKTAPDEQVNFWGNLLRAYLESE